VSQKANGGMIRAIVTDIEGTTTSLSFVHDVLFPYAANRLASFVVDHSAESAVRSILEQVRSELGDSGAPLPVLIDKLQAWAAEDRKIGPLKTLQGLIWEAGYRNGDFKGHVYPDAVASLRLWREQGLRLYVYSSGSIQAQKLLFGHSELGDLTPLFTGYFDTATGPKREKDSYHRIVEAINLPASVVLFLSDVAEELDAAAAAGLRTTQLVRPGTQAARRHPVAHDFNEVSLNC
jgi:enolase-phosphatase E1